MRLIAEALSLVGDAMEEVEEELKEAADKGEETKALETEQELINGIAVRIIESLGVEKQN